MAQTTGEKIRILRERKKLSQRELAKLVGMNQSVLHKIETGFVKKTTYLIDIARILGVDPYRLIDEHRRIKK